MNDSSMIAKIWNFCTILRDDGIGYGDYLEQITYLIFLKMADEYSKPPHKQNIGIPKEYSWQNLLLKSGSDLETHYISLLQEL